LHGIDRRPTVKIAVGEEFEVADHGVTGDPLNAIHYHSDLICVDR
jgi:hypothetical protein